MNLYKVKLLPVHIDTMRFDNSEYVLADSLEKVVKKYPNALSIKKKRSDLKIL